jgi:hypothetical protein
MFKLCDEQRLIDRIMPIFDDQRDQTSETTILL